MTHLFLTIDTELSPALHKRGVSPADNFASSILGRLADGAWGVPYQARRFEEHGLKAVFFVEALSAHVLGLDLLKQTIDPILAGGHEVQLHIHTEWLPWFQNSPVKDRHGWCIADFPRGDQRVLLELGMETLVKAGAPRPTAFRAGNFGANNDTLRAASDVGLTYDSSYNSGYLQACRIVSDRPLLDVTKLDGVVELPVTSFHDFGTHHRHAQLCANSISELRLIVDQAVAQGRRTVVIVSHSFELLNRARNRANRLIVDRFERLCGLLQERKEVAPTSLFSGLNEHALLQSAHAARPLRSHALRTAWRMAEQAWGTLRYEQH